MVQDYCRLAVHLQAPSDRRYWLYDVGDLSNIINTSLKSVISVIVLKQIVIVQMWSQSDMYYGICRRM